MPAVLWGALAVLGLLVSGIAVYGAKQTAIHAAMRGQDEEADVHEPGASDEA